MDGIDALPDENAQERKYRNGAARPGLQHETGDAHSGRWRFNGSDPRLKQAAQPTDTPADQKRWRFYTTWARSGHSQSIDVS